MKITKERSGHFNEKHGLSGTKIGTTYGNMMRRCYNETCDKFHVYGGRGITVCDEWKNDILEFAAWCVKNNMSADSELDRIDNSKGYSPDNCRLCTHVENLHNTRSRGGKSAYKGVTHHPSTGKWTARIAIDHNRKYLGLFKTEEEAAIAYNNAATELFGEYAWINKIGD